jgi:hypothetical protein
MRRKSRRILIIQRTRHLRNSSVRAVLSTATQTASSGDTTVKEDLLKGRKVGNTTYKVHLDGYNLLPAFKRRRRLTAKGVIYWTDNGSVAALRYGNWKVTFLRQDAHGMKV